MSIKKKHSSFLELFYLKKENIPCDFLIDEIDVDSCFFHNFMDVYVVQFRILRLSKGLFRETYPIKKFFFDQHFAYQSYEVTAELLLTRKENLFILENLLTKNTYDNISKTLFFPYPTPKLVKTPQQSSLFLHFSKEFQSSKSCMIRFGIRYQKFALKNSSTLSYFFKSTSK